MGSVTAQGKLAESRFVEVVTYRRDGTPVSTPMLLTPRGDSFLLRTHHTAGKLKRLRRNATVELTPRSHRGRRLGEPARGTARILPEADTAACLALLHRHHGLFGRAATWLRHRHGRDVFIEVRLD